MRALFTAAAAALGIALAAVGCLLCYKEGGAWELAGYIVLCLAFFPVASLIHESGHILCGRACGMRVKLSKIGVFGPSACTVVPKGSKKIRRSFIVTAAGGLAANFLFALLGGMALLGGGVVLMLSFVAPSSLYLFIINAVPANYAGGGTDALLIARAAKNTAEWQVLERVLTVQGMLAEGARLEDIDGAMLFDVPQIMEDEPAFIMLVSLRADYFKAKGDEKNAAKWQERLNCLLAEYGCGN